MEFNGALAYYYKQAMDDDEGWTGESSKNIHVPIWV